MKPHSDEWRSDYNRLRDFLVQNVQQTRQPSYGASWLELLENSNEAAIVAVLGDLWSRGADVAERTAFRDAARAALDVRLAKRTMETMVRLESTASKLAWVGVGASIIIGVAGIAVPLALKFWWPAA